MIKIRLDFHHYTDHSKWLKRNNLFYKLMIYNKHYYYIIIDFKKILTTLPFRIEAAMSIHSTSDAVIQPTKEISVCTDVLTTLLNCMSRL